MKYDIEEWTWWEAVNSREFYGRKDLVVTLTDKPMEELEREWHPFYVSCGWQDSIWKLLSCERKWDTLKKMHDDEFFDLDTILDESFDPASLVIAKLYYDRHFKTNLEQLKHILTKEEHQILIDFVHKKYNETHNGKIIYDEQGKKWQLVAFAIPVFKGDDFGDAIDRCERIYGSMERYDYLLAFTPEDYFFQYIGDDEDFVIEDDYDYERAYERKELIWYAIPDPKKPVYIIDLNAYYDPYEAEEYEEEDEDNDYEDYYVYEEEEEEEEEED